MRERIDEYYISEERERRIWSNCIFVFDSSALLNFYGYSEATRQDIFTAIFSKISGRLWIPQHVEYEYLKNREATLKKPTSLYNELKNDLDKISNQITNLKNRTKKIDKHPHLDTATTEKFEKSFGKLKVQIQNEIQKRIDEINAMAENDTVFHTFSSFLDVGQEYSYEKIMQIVQEGELRYKFGIPPGYKDQDKIGFQIFGDLIIWKQIQEYAEEQKKPVIYITDDEKEDWWIFAGKGKKVVGPREELVKEIKDKANVDFWMYTEGFLDAAQRMLDIKIKDKTIDEVKSASIQSKAILIEEAVIEWAHEYFKDEGELNYPEPNIETGVDFVLDGWDHSVTGFVVKYYSGDGNESRIYQTLKRMIENVDVTIYSEMNIIVVLDDRNSASSMRSALGQLVSSFAANQEIQVNIYFGYLNDEGFKLV